MLIGIFPCRLEGGTLVLPDMFPADRLAFTCSFGTFGGDRRFLLFSRSSKQTPFHPWFVRQLGRFRGKAFIRKARLMLPHKAMGYFAEGAELELIGMGTSFLLREPNGRIYWNTLPNGKISLVFAGKTACEASLTFHENDVLLSRSSFPHGKMPGIFRQLLCAFLPDILSFEDSPARPCLSLGVNPTSCFAPEIEKNIWLALRHTGLSIVVADVADAESCTMARGILRLAVKWEKPTILIAVLPAQCDGEAGFQTALDALRHIHKIPFRGSIIVLRKEKNDNDSLLAGLGYALGGILLPFTQYARASARLLSAREVLFSGSCLQLSANTLAESEGMDSLKEALRKAAKAFGDTYIAAFGSVPMSPSELEMLLPKADNKRPLPFSFCYGDLPQLYEEMVLLSFTPFLA